MDISKTGIITKMQRKMKFFLKCYRAVTGQMYYMHI